MIQSEEKCWFSMAPNRGDEIHLGLDGSYALYFSKLIFCKYLHSIYLVQIGRRDKTCFPLSLCLQVFVVPRVIFEIPPQKTKQKHARASGNTRIYCRFH